MRVSKQNKSRSEKMKAYWAARRAPMEPYTKQAVKDYLNKMDLPYNDQFDKQPDMVNHPAHYTFSKFEVADVSDEWYGNEPHLWNANKYLARWDKKGDPIENLEKAVWYIQRKIDRLKEK